MCYCDAEMPEFLNKTTPRARRTHWCCECGTAIRPGTKYQRNTGKWDGEVQTYVRCSECSDLVRFMYWWSKQTEGCYCEVYSNLMEDVGEEWRSGQAKLIGIAYIAMKRRWWRDRDERIAAREKRKAALALN